MLELIVALGVFSLAVLSAVSIFITTLNAQRRILATQTNVDNIRYVMEIIGKEARMAKQDAGYCGHAGQVFYTSPNGRELSFVNYRNECVTYSVTNGRLMKDLVVDDVSSGEIPITADTIAITKVEFISQEIEEPLLVAQPRITILLKFVSNVVGTKNTESISVQTTISSRYYD